jgi:hypothetical protein
VQQSARDLDPTPLAATQPARFVPALVDQPHALDLGGDASGGIAMRQSMQSTMVKEVLLDREVQVEGRLLEDDPDKPQAIQGTFADVHAEDADRSLGLSVEPRGE